VHALVFCDQKSDQMKVDVSDQNDGFILDILDVGEASLVDLSLAEVRLSLAHLGLP
jgi:hypothetical protein